MARSFILINKGACPDKEEMSYGDTIKDGSEHWNLYYIIHLDRMEHPTPEKLRLELLQMLNRIMKEGSQ